MEVSVWSGSTADGSLPFPELSSGGRFEFKACTLHAVKLAISVCWDALMPAYEWPPEFKCSGPLASPRAVHLTVATVSVRQHTTIRTVVQNALPLPEPNSTAGCTSSHSHPLFPPAPNTHNKGSDPLTSRANFVVSAGPHGIPRLLSSKADLAICLSGACSCSMHWQYGLFTLHACSICICINMYSIYYVVYIVYVCVSICIVYSIYMYQYV